MKQYMSYKSCRIRWIGQIPSEWKVSKVKYLALENNSIFMDGDWINSEIIESEGIRYLTTGNVGAGEYKEQGDSFISEKSFSRLNCLTVLPGDVLISRLNEPIARACIVPDTYDKYVVAVDELKSKLDEFRVYWASEIESFAKVFFKPGKKQGNMDFGILNSFLDPAVDRYKGLDENEQEEFKSTLTKFVRAYTFLTNIIRLDDADLHKFHAYAKFLQNKLPKREGGGQVFLDDEVALQYYRVQKIFEGSIALEQSDPLPNKIHPGKPKLEEEKAPLSELIDKINEKFGTEFTNIDKVLEQIVSDMDANEELRIQARNNSQEHFRFPFNDAFMDVVIGRMAQNQQFCERVLDDAKFGDTVRDLLIGVVYDRLRRPTDAQL